MSTVIRHLTVKPPPDVVVPYLADFAHAEQWDPGTVTCTPNQTGPVAVGSTWHNTSKLAGISTELTYELTELTDSRVVLVGTNKTATSKEIIDVVAEGAGSRVTYTNELEFNGAAKLATPLAKLLFERVGDELVKTLGGTLDALAQ